ncbi:hypothetical protein U27_01551 [Candidatus Vecturithrix granuli]|uniref:Uncharacterized protein n=1 Tax=Vecturithrix granuli TaxID=1499967 RepID=A0A081CAP5_VECG1|nr:hypothetical protein U27_01551 [Candidatus Vecturithrix granuli]
MRMLGRDLYFYVSNPSRDYSAFLHIMLRLNNFKMGSFKPFQGLFRVSTYPGFSPRGIKYLFQTLPGIIPRFYFVLRKKQSMCRRKFQTLPGIIPRFYGMI